MPEKDQRVCLDDSGDGWDPKTSNDAALPDETGLEAGEDDEDDKEEEEDGKPKSCREQLASILETNLVQYSIIALVLLDSLIVVLEMLIDLDILKIPEPQPVSFNETLTTHNISTDHAYEPLIIKVHHNISTHHNHKEEPHNGHHELSGFHGNESLDIHHDQHRHDVHHHSNREIAEHILHYASLTILSIFVVEVFDAVIVIVSFSMDIAFSFVTVSSAARDAAGLMVLLRLWRITRIINGVIMSVKKDADKKINEQKTLRNKAERKLERMSAKVKELQEEVEKLKKRLSGDKDDAKVTQADFQQTSDVIVSE